MRISQSVDGSTADGTSTIIAIRDDGIGVDSSDRRRLFERFFRGTRARQHAPDGTGLGLAIAQTIVARHSGSMAIGPGDTITSRGCCVTIDCQW